MGQQRQKQKEDGNNENQEDERARNMNTKAMKSAINKDDHESNNYTGYVNERI